MGTAYAHGAHARPPQARPGKARPRRGALQKPLTCPAHDSHARHNSQALASAGVAWADGGLESLDPMRCGILIGSAMGGMKTFSAAIETLHVQARLSLTAVVNP